MTTVHVPRRSFLLAIPQVALTVTAGCAFGSASASRSTSQPTPAASLGGAAGEPRPPVDPATVELATVEPVREDDTPAPRRTQPLPLPVEDDRAWLQEWLDLIAMPGRQPSTGC